MLFLETSLDNASALSRDISRKSILPMDLNKTAI